jgi:CubicO group peptidase (beta-lactamase class C family)
MTIGRILRQAAYSSWWLGMAFISIHGAAWADGGISRAAPAVPPLQETLQTLAHKHGICNVTVVVLKARQLEAAAAAQGCAAETPLTPDDVFEAASLSKPVFAYAVLKLVQAGQMSLDAPVMQYLPQGYAHRFHPYLSDSPVDLVTDPRLQAVTVRMALSHTAGLPNWSGGPLTFDGTPGEKWQYSGEGYALLQRAVEAVTHESLDAFMARQVFRPLGMAHSEFAWKPRLEKLIVPGTDRDGVPLKPWPFIQPVSAFTLYTSARDYSFFLSALLQDELALRQIVAAPVPVNPKLDLSWGLGWGLERGQDEDFIWHWGHNPGYRAFVMASPRTGDGFVMFTGSDNGLAMVEALGDEIMGSRHPVFRFHLLRDGLANWLCETVDICP